MLKNISLAIFVASILSGRGFAQTLPAYKIFGKSTSIIEVAKENQGDFFEIERKRYEVIERIAQEKYFEEFWKKMGKDKKTTPEQAKEDFLAKAVKVSESEVKETLARFKDHPQLSKLPAEEQKKQIRDYLKDKAAGEALQDVLIKARKSGDLVVLVSEPVEPVYPVTVNDQDYVKYGPKEDDIKPVGCKADDCPITIVEYSEFECPYCSRVMPDVKKVLTEYKGKIRWVVRDFPLSFHARAKPAAIAAKCAGEQGKYWSMYHKLFDNQTKLSDEDLTSYAKAIGLNLEKFANCQKNPKALLAKIEENIQSGAKYGVNGTPAFFINGKKLSGARSYEDFKQIIDSDLSKKR